MWGGVEGRRLTSLDPSVPPTVIAVRAWGTPLARSAATRCAETTG
jgi:hypothetical protein